MAEQSDRPPAFVKMQIVYSIGLDIGGTTIKGGRVDARGHVHQAITRPTDSSNIENLITTLAEMVEELESGHQILAVGLGVPGVRSSATGQIRTSPNIPCLDGTRPDLLLGTRVSPVVIARNDADMSAWGEFRVGAGAGTRHMICLTLGTGVGSGIVLAGELYNGAHGYAAEAGHLTVDPQGRACGCGNRGCLETVASATGIVASARSWPDTHERPEIPEPWTTEALARLAMGGHVGAIRIFEQAGRHLGLACASLMNLLNPEAIVVGGGVMGSGALLLPSAIDEARRRAFPATFETCSIVPAQLGSQAGLVGAALLAQDITASDPEQ